MMKRILMIFAVFAMFDFVANANPTSAPSASPKIDFEKFYGFSISLGIRDLGKDYPQCPFPLAFRIKNLKSESQTNVYFDGKCLDGTLHIQSKDGKKMQLPIRSWIIFYSIFVGDVKPQETFECGLIANLFDFNPFIRDGDYEVWWTYHNRLKSNSLHFRVKGDQVEWLDEKANGAPDSAPTPTAS